MIQYSQCPVCNSSNIQPHITAKDYTVSQQVFSIWGCKNCTVQFTQQVPSQNEIGGYYKASSYISHTDTKQGLINKLYHIVRKRTLTAKRTLIEKITSSTSGSILDIGCGTGAFLNEMQTANWQITGLEPDDAARKIAKDQYQINALPSHEIFTITPGSYDVVTMWHVLEHVHELQAYMQQIHNLLKPHGKLFIAVPNYTSYDAAVYKEYWAAYDVPRHLYHFSPKSIEQLIIPYGFKLIQMKPMWFDSFYVSMLSEQYKGGNIIRAFFIGLLSNIRAMGAAHKCSSVIYVIEKK
jgi:2-polyprenyl-3-methyl-5-hydroxy-6-metoxy-1,4-benzoquinol methylase